MLCVQRWSVVRPAGRVKCWQVQSREPKTGQQKVQLYEDDPLCPSRYIIYLCSPGTEGEGAQAGESEPGHLSQVKYIYIAV